MLRLVGLIYVSNYFIRAHIPKGHKRNVVSDMNLLEFTSALPKPWLDIKADTLEANEIVALDRMRQDGGHFSSYGLWSCLNDFTVSATAPQFAMGSFVGPVLIPAASIYAGMSIRIVVAGILTTVGANTLTLSIRDLAGTFVHSSIAHTVGATPGLGLKAEFDIQVAAPGAAGVAIERSVAALTIDNVPGFTAVASNTTTFATTAGMELYLYGEFSAPGDSLLRQLAYATVMN